MMKSHLHPAIPLTPSRPANTPAAMSPENPVAKICAQYNKAIRVATSTLSVNKRSTNSTVTVKHTFPRVEDTQHVRRSWIERRLRNTQKEPTSNQPAKVLHQCRAPTHNRPDQHPRTHVDTRLDAGNQHIGRNLHKHVADEEDGDGGVELHARHTEILFEIVEARLSDSIAVHIILSTRQCTYGGRLRGVVEKPSWQSFKHPRQHQALSSTTDRQRTYEEIHRTQRRLYFC